MFFKHLDLSDARRVFVVGDIHGMFSLLDTRLAELGFDYEQDHLLSVGDLIDRGPESHLAIEYAAKPWFHFVLGNHEQLAKAHYRGNPNVHVNNGGRWFTHLPHEEQAKHVGILNDAPVIMEITVPSGKRIGIVHANFPTDDWHDVYDLEQEYERQWTEHCLWDRNEIRYPTKESIRNIDHVYYGHNPLYKVYHRGNCSWIDTAACQSGNMTVLEI